MLKQGKTRNEEALSYMNKIIKTPNFDNLVYEIMFDLFNVARKIVYSKYLDPSTDPVSLFHDLTKHVQEDDLAYYQFKHRQNDQNIDYSKIENKPYFRSLDKKLKLFENIDKVDETPKPESSTEDKTNPAIPIKNVQEELTNPAIPKQKEASLDVSLKKFATEVHSQQISDIVRNYKEDLTGAITSYLLKIGNDLSPGVNPGLGMENAIRSFKELFLTNKTGYAIYTVLYKLAHDIINIIYPVYSDEDKLYWGKFAPTEINMIDEFERKSKIEEFILQFINLSALVIQKNLIEFAETTEV